MTPYSYRAGNSILHRQGAGLKLATLCACSFAAFFAGLPGLAFSSLVVLLGAAVARIPLPSLFAGSSALAFTTLFVVALRSIQIDGWNFGAPKIDLVGLRESLIFAWGVFVSFAGGSVLFAATTTMDLRFALSRGESGVKSTLQRFTPAALFRKIDALDVSLTVALALAFIPRVFSVWEAAEDAHRARCGAKGIAGTVKLVPLVAERLIEAAAETASAMVSRGYTGGYDVTGSRPHSTKIER